MAIIECDLDCDANLLHLEQIYAGFARLHRQGVIKVRQLISKPDPRYIGWTGLRVLVNGAIKLYYDTFDGPDLNTQALEEVSYYFKRSLDRNRLNTNSKVHPLGLNYAVSDRRFDIFKLKRDFSFGTAGARLVTTLKDLTSKRRPTMDELSSPPVLQQTPRVLFLTRVYDPQKSTPESRQMLEAINSMRANCVRWLRKELKERFLGGIAPNEYALKYCRDAIIEDAHWGNATSQYLSILRQFPICVATKGMWNSIGYKFAEYVSHSKAIVTEPLDYLVPGELIRDKNYVEFTTADKCVEAAQMLLSDAQLRHSLMINNFRYYNSYVRPDSLVLNTLAVALGYKDNSSSYR
jgi:hypothetical protein